MKALFPKIRWYLYGSGLIIAGLGLLYFGFYGQSWFKQPWPNQPMLTVNATPKSTMSPTKTDLIVPFPGNGRPVSLVVPDAQIQLPVAEGHYNARAKTWTLSRDQAHFAVMTAQPNSQQGQTFIYGHNRPAVFSRLDQLKPGSLAYVTTSANERFTYRYSHVKTTVPTDGAVLDYQGAPILTLQTCTGSAFQNRSLYTFELVGAEDV